MNIHTCFLDSNGDLATGAKQVPKIRNHIENLPETAATFKLKSVGGVDTHLIYPDHLALAKTWEMPDIYTSNSSKKLVNPNHEHVERYSDLIVSCRCGAKMTRSKDKGPFELLGGTSHTKECRSYYMLEARSNLQKEAHQMACRLAKLGWSSEYLSGRLRVSDGRLRDDMDNLNTSMKEMKAEYMEKGANTYTYLVREHDYSADVIADIYGVTRRTLSNWADKYATYSPSGSALRFGTDDQGRYSWSKERESKEYPEWLKKSLGRKQDNE